jgi:Bax protein
LISHLYKFATSTFLILALWAGNTLSQTSQEVFIHTIAKAAQSGNAESLKIRTWLAQRYVYFQLSPQDQAVVLDLADEYWVNVDDKSFKQVVGELLIKIDEVPPSLVVAQAINESGWGRSRFAREANNLFGMWCYTPGCGLVPERRRANDKHEVKRYASIQDSVDEYLRNINRNKAYIELRELRARQRQRMQLLSGEYLAQGLSEYSSIGAEYVNRIRNIIDSRQLDRLDQQYKVPGYRR